MKYNSSQDLTNMDPNGNDKERTGSHGPMDHRSSSGTPDNLSGRMNSYPTIKAKHDPGTGIHPLASKASGNRRTTPE